MTEQKSTPESISTTSKEAKEAATKRVAKSDINGNQKDEAEEPHILFYDNVIHYRKESRLSQFDSQLSFEGFKNLINVIVIIASSRLFVENIIKYGFRINPITWIQTTLQDPSCWILFAINMLHNFYIVISVILERFYVFYLDSRGRISQHRLPPCTVTYSYGEDARKLTMLKFKTYKIEERIFRYIWLSIMSLTLFVPIVMVNTLENYNYFWSVVTCVWHIFAFMKIYSYHEVNSWWRTGKLYDGCLEAHSKNNEKLEQYQGETLRSWNASKLVVYPQNLTLKNAWHFLYMPTMCYQCNFPLKMNRNYWFLFRSILELMLLGELTYQLFHLWLIVPLSQNELRLSNITVSEFFLRWTKMSMGAIILFLISFYMVLHSITNTFAELTYLADRNFYDDWWNCKTVSEFWRKWNKPVSRFFKRHVFDPLVLTGYSRFWAAAVVYFWSGVFHEYLISVPFRHFSLHFLIAFLLQLVLEFIVIRIRSWYFSNGLIWFAFTMAMSLMIILYYNDLMHVLEQKQSRLS